MGLHLNPSVKTHTTTHPPIQDMNHLLYCMYPRLLKLQNHSFTLSIVYEFPRLSQCVKLCGWTHTGCLFIIVCCKRNCNKHFCRHVVLPEWLPWSKIGHVLWPLEKSPSPLSSLPVAGSSVQSLLFSSVPTSSALYPLVGYACSCYIARLSCSLFIISL